VLLRLWLTAKKPGKRGNHVHPVLCFVRF